MKVCDVTTDIFVNISCITNCIDPVIESHNRIFSLFAWFVTSFSPLHRKFIIKAMFGEREGEGEGETETERETDRDRDRERQRDRERVLGIHILAQAILKIEHAHMLHILVTCL